MPKSTLFDSHVKKYAYYEAEEVYREIGTSKDGLVSEQIEMIQQRYDVNSFITKKKDTTICRLRRASVNPFNVILFVLGMISLVADTFLAPNSARNAAITIIIFSMILVGGMIRPVQELRAKNATKQLNRLLHESITVGRGGELTEIPVEELVMGDIVLFPVGDRVPADIRLTEVTGLFISWASITGESAILEKDYHIRNRGGQITLTQPENLVFMATTVISGKGKGIVLAVGEDTLYGSFAELDSGDKNSFQNGVGFITWVVFRFMAILAPIVFVLLGITGGERLESPVFALSVAIELIPETLPMVTTVCLAEGSLTMSRKQTVIRDINTMRGFGSMDVPCMDKTGTLTNESILLGCYMDVLGNENTEALDLVFLNSSYHPGIHNPVDNTILARQIMSGRETHYTNLFTQYQRIGGIPFDYARKLVSILVTGRNGESQSTMRGDISHIVARCSCAEYRGEILPAEKSGIQSATAMIGEMLQDEMKVITVARKNMEYKKWIISADETGTILMGYLVFSDAPRKTAKAFVMALKKLKVTPKILTGNQVDVVVSVRQRVEISSETVLAGAGLDGMIDNEFSTAIGKVHVFTELTSERKIRLVSTLRRNGHTVGFLDDRTNDIPALCEANVGILVSIAVDAAKNAADVMLFQKGLDVLEQGILEGRRTFTSMFKYIKITTSSNLGSILSIVCASAFLLLLPVTSVQTLLLNLLYNILCIALP